MGIKYNEKSCGMVLFREKDGTKLYLLLHYLGNHWDLVKGHVEEGESEHETATRELLEETGIADIKYVEGFREEVSYWYKRAGKPSHKQVVFFLAKTELEDVRLSHEHKGFKWLPYNAAFNKLSFDNAQTLLKKAKEFLED